MVEGDVRRNLHALSEQNDDAKKATGKNYQQHEIAACACRERKHPEWQGRTDSSQGN